jgi:hypothetical protein
VSTRCALLWKAGVSACLDERDTHLHLRLTTESICPHQTIEAVWGMFDVVHCRARTCTREIQRVRYHQRRVASGLCSCFVPFCCAGRLRYDRQVGVPHSGHRACGHHHCNAECACRPWPVDAPGVRLGMLASRQWPKDSLQANYGRTDNMGF